MMQRLQAELNMIVDAGIRQFTEYVLRQAPAYFWTVASSSTGKYHPPQSNGEGGLIRHTRAVVYFANKLCDVYSITGQEKDCVLSACLLHDIVKYGETKGQHTTKNHDYVGGLFTLRHGRVFGLEEETLKAIAGCIAWHMGRWTDMNGRKVKKEFPGDYTKGELITHLADVISAQKNVGLSHL